MNIEQLAKALSELGVKEANLRIESGIEFEKLKNNEFKTTQDAITIDSRGIESNPYDVFIVRSHGVTIYVTLEEKSSEGVIK